MTGLLEGDLPGKQAIRDWVARREEYWANPPIGTCTECQTSDVLLMAEEPRCAECARKTANRHQAEFFYPCDKCGAPEAFRDPAHRRDEYLCTACHTRDGFVPGERAMLNKTTARVGVTHPLGRKAVCILASSTTPCGGEIKQRSKHGMICNRHWDPVKYDARKG